jgi:hypothetical protein
MKTPEKKTMDPFTHSSSENTDSTVQDKPDIHRKEPFPQGGFDPEVQAPTILSHTPVDTGLRLYYGVGEL